ncbi:MAG: FG-GAP repeat domain-containing protein, partial [bacterium]
MKKLLIFSLIVFITSCRNSEKTDNSIKRNSQNASLTLFQFTDVTEIAGIDFVHYNGAYGKKYFPEMAGAGCGFLDFDNDGWLDILLVNGKNWPSHPGKKEPTMALYRNLRDGTFEDVTEK